MRAAVLAFLLVVGGAAVAHAQVPTLPVPLSTTTTTQPATTTSEPEQETTTTETLGTVDPNVVIEPPPPETAPAPVVVVDGTTTSTSVVHTSSKEPRSSVASALTGAFAVALATVFAVAGIFVSLSIRSRARR